MFMCVKNDLVINDVNVDMHVSHFLHSLHVASNLHISQIKGKNFNFKTCMLHPADELLGEEDLKQNVWGTLNLEVTVAVECLH